MKFQIKIKGVKLDFPRFNGHLKLCKNLVKVPVIPAKAGIQAVNFLLNAG